MESLLYSKLSVLIMPMKCVVDNLMTNVDTRQGQGSVLHDGM